MRLVNMSRLYHPCSSYSLVPVSFAKHEEVIVSSLDLMEQKLAMLFEYAAILEQKAAVVAEMGL